MRQEENRVAVDTLIIDDSPSARRIIRHHLEEIRCRVIGEAENAAQGLKLFRELKPQLITHDLILPAVDGIDATTAFQTMRRCMNRSSWQKTSAIIPKRDLSMPFCGLTPGRRNQPNCGSPL